MRFRTAFIVILRSPLDALIAFSRATQNLWRRSAPLELNQENITKTLKRNARLLAHVLKTLAFYDARIVSYGQLINFPELTLKDLTAFFGYRYASTQLTYYRNIQRSQGGDLEVFNDPKPADPERVSKYDKAVADLRDQYASLPVIKLASQAHADIKALAETSIPLYPGDQATQDLMRIFENMGNC
jgi:hypothetical protein